MLKRFVSVFVMSVLLLCVSVNVPGGHVMNISVAMAADTWTNQQEQYLRTVLASHIAEPCKLYDDGLVYNMGNDEVLLDCDRVQHMLMSVGVSGLMTLFSDAIPDTAPPASLPAPIYDALTAIETASCNRPDVNGCYGYQQYFDRWKAEGLMN